MYFMLRSAGVRVRWTVLHLNKHQVSIVWKRSNTQEVAKPSAFHWFVNTASRCLPEETLTLLLWNFLAKTVCSCRKQKYKGDLLVDAQSWT